MPFKMPRTLLFYLAAALCLGAPARPGCAASNGAQTPPAAFRVAVISDLNGDYGSAAYGEPVRAAVREIVREKPDLVLIAGDMIAGEKNSLTDAQFSGMWRAFGAAVAAPLAEAGIPVAAVPGNHDASAYPGYERDREFYKSEWLARKPALRFLDDSRYPFEYAFSAGGALFIALDQTTMAKLSPERLAWVDKVLTEHAEFAVKIVLAHLPLFPFTQGREKEVTGDTGLSALLARHGVALVITGHDHGYYPARRGPLRYLSLGCLGGGPRKLIGGSKVSAQSFSLLTLTPGEGLGIGAFAYPGFSAPIERATLPASVGEGGFRYVRDDLEP